MPAPSSSCAFCLGSAFDSQRGRDIHLRLALLHNILQVQVVRSPHYEDLEALLKQWQPNVVYIYGASSISPVDSGGHGDNDSGLLPPLSMAKQDDLSIDIQEWISLLNQIPLDLVYLDAADTLDIGKAILTSNCCHAVVAWPTSPHPPLQAALHFAHALLACLAHPTATPLEAYAIAREMTRAFSQPFPCLLVQGQGGNGDFGLLAPLPDNSTVPPMSGPLTSGLGTRPFHEILPGFASIRTCAPQAEVELLFTGLPSSMDANALGNLCQALRGLLTLEARTLTLTSTPTRCSAPLTHLSEKSVPVRCETRTASGYALTIVIAGPEDVLSKPGVAEHALRHCLTADAHAIQLKVLAAGGKPLFMESQSSTKYASGAPLISTIAVTSTWVVQVLTLMAKDLKARALVAAGIGAVGKTPVAAFQTADSLRLTNLTKLITLNPGIKASIVGINGKKKSNSLKKDIPLVVSDKVNGQAPLATPALPAAGVGPRRPVSGPPSRWGDAQELLNGGDAEIIPGGDEDEWISSRPALNQCDESDFMSDLAAFLTLKIGRNDVSSYLDVAINGSKLDLFGLYKAICRNGGYEAASVNLDWEQHVFPAMRNWVQSQDYPKSAIVNALKMYYQQFLLEYEHAHPYDISS